MAEAVLFSLAADVLMLAGSITDSEIKLVRGTRDELNGLKDTVETIRAVLLDAEKQRWHNNQVKLWLGRLKDVLYDVQDLLDDVATEDLRRKVTSGNKMSKRVRVFFSKSNQLAHRLKVANEIRVLRKKLDWIKKDREFHLEEHQSEETMAIGRGKKTEAFTPDRAIIGREEDKKKIKQLLLSSSSNKSVSFVAIVGKGGLGKTAIARLVYNDGEVRHHFELKMWVCVSDVFDVNSIIKDILKSANVQDLENKTLDQLLNLLHETLSRKKYLLVLDDLWNEYRDKWLKLAEWLEGGLRGSKVLMTTRSHRVAEVADVRSVIHVLRGLSEDKSWNLFKKMAFEDGAESSDSGLEEIGRDIVKKCAGVPLAIRTIGGLLYGKRKDEWLRYKVRELPEIQEIDEADDGIMQVLKFSYDHLRSCLKHCFAYCSLFPKDYVYHKERMIHYWVAQGFIESRNGENNLEEIGGNYLSELLCRSFLDVASKDDYGEVLTFKMHDLMHDLAYKVAGDECKIVNFNGGVSDGGIRHASFTTDTFSKEKMVSLLKTSKLRTFLYLEGDGLREESSMLEKIFSWLRHCRVLDLGNTFIPPRPSSFEKLKHLRFLNISANKSIQSLPDSIVDLVNLQTLKLSRCKDLKTLPRDLRKLVNLRHLIIEWCDTLTHLPPLSELPSLRTLILEGLYASEFLQQKSDPEQSNTTPPFFPSLERLTLLYLRNLKGWWERSPVYENHLSDNSRSSFPKLWDVTIRGCPDLDFVPPFTQVEYLKIDSTKMLGQQFIAPSEAAVGSIFNPFSKLKHLYLDGTDLNSRMLETLFTNLESMRLDCCDLSCLSHGMRHLSSLLELEIRQCERLNLLCQECEHVTQWQFLTKLRVLKIIDFPHLMVLPEGIQHITTLQSLEISHCWLQRLPGWITSFSLLEKLVLSHCPNLKRFPFGMCNLTRLKELRIIRCPALKEMCLTDGREDWPKIAHIPVIIWED